MDLTVNLPDIRGNLSLVWPLHEPYTQTFVENSIISDLKTKCRPFEQVGPHAKCAMTDWIYGNLKKASRRFYSGEISSQLLRESF